MIRLTPHNRHFFFGYYDKTPWNADESKILACEVDVYKRLPSETDWMKVGYLDLSRDGAFVEIAQTFAWSVQQGCMSQWADRNGKEHVVFNTQTSGHAHARWINPDSGMAKDQDLPVYAMSQDGLYFASVDFGRLGRLRPGYGYEGVVSRYSSEAAPVDDGLILVEVESGQSRLLVGYAELAEQIAPRGVGAPHWIDHIEFSPDGMNVVFLHRWLSPDGGPLSRLMTISTSGERLRCLLDSGAAGHGLWLDGKTYGIWGRKSNMAANVRSNTSKWFSPLRAIVKLARVVIPANIKRGIHGETFLAIDVETSKLEESLVQLPRVMQGGHPSLHPQAPWVVSDTLPDSIGNRTLFTADLAGRELNPLITLQHDPKWANASFRCDFHPRWNRSGTAVCIDSVHEGFRGMYTIEPVTLLGNDGNRSAA